MRWVPFLLSDVLLAILLYRLGFKRTAAAITGPICIFLVLAILCLTQYFVAQTSLPLVDPYLMAFDAHIASWQLFYEGVAHSPFWTTVFTNVYDRTFHVLFILTAAVAFRDPLRMWRMMLANLVCGLVVIGLFGLFPTIGPAAYLGLPDYFPAEGLASSTKNILLLKAGLLHTMPVGGLVYFPSYHAVALILTAWGVAVFPRWVRWPTYGWVTLSYLTVAPIGGHYFADIVAGTLITLSWLYRQQIREIFKPRTVWQLLSSEN